MQRLGVDLENYNEVLEYAPQWAIDKWSLHHPKTLLLVWTPHWWPWGKSHGTWRSRLQVKRD